MKKNIRIIFSLIMVLALMVSMASCGNEEEEEIEAEDAAMTQEVEQGPAVKYTIDGIDESEMDEPLQIESITLFEDGTVLVVPTDDLRKNEMKEDPEGEGIYPFADSGKVKDVYVMNFGNAGYRTIVALLEDGTISCVNAGALIEDHIIAVMNNVAGRDNFVKVENVTDESASGIVGTTDDGEEVVLDYSINMTSDN